MKRLNRLLQILAVPFIMMSCEGTSELSGKIEYPESSTDLLKTLIKTIDFTAPSNPDTIVYAYDNKGRVKEEKSSRNAYVRAYTYNDDGTVASEEVKSIDTEAWISKSSYIYINNRVIIETKTNMGGTDSLIWTLNAEKAISSKRIIKSGSTEEYVTDYEWTSENLSKSSRYRKIDFVTSFEYFQDFPPEMERSLERVADFYNLRLKASGEAYYLVQEDVFESYNDAINIQRYLSSAYPVALSQQIPMVIARSSYDEEKKRYVELLSYTTYTADELGYPSRIITGGAGSVKVDFIYSTLINSSNHE